MAHAVPDQAVSVRRALPEDAGHILDITRAANAEYAGRWALSAVAESSSDVFGDLQKGAVFLAAADGQYVGAVRCRVLDDGSGYIKRLAVLPAWRRRGIATLLMHAAESHLHLSAARRVTLGTVAENSAVTAFYLSLGYHVTETKEVPTRRFRAHAWDKQLGAKDVAVTGSP